MFKTFTESCQWLRDDKGQKLSSFLTKLIELPHDKTNKMTVLPVKTRISLGIRPVWLESSLCAKLMAKWLWTQAFFMRTAKTPIRLGGCPHWSKSSLGAHAILLVLSWGGSYGRLKLTSQLVQSLSDQHLYRKNENSVHLPVLMSLTCYNPRHHTLSSRSLWYHHTLLPDYTLSS